jgi:hypothetical protein
LKLLEPDFSENSKRIIVVLVIISLGVLMAARKQFDVNFAETMTPWVHSVIEGQSKELGHIHPLFRKDTFVPLVMTWPTYSMYYSETFHVISAILNWIAVIALTVMIIRRVGFDYSSSIIITMYILFVGNLAARAFAKNRWEPKLIMLYFLVLLPEN